MAHEPQRIGELLPSIPPAVAEALALEVEDARQAGALGFYARVLAQVTMPHSRPEIHEYSRQNGQLILSMWAPRHIGLPYGTIPRIVLLWVTTEAVRTKERRLVLGQHLSTFMQEIDMVPTGGRWGTIPRLREGMLRLFSSSITCNYGDATTPVAAGAKLDVATEWELWWDPRTPRQGALWQSTVTLGNKFFEEITTRPIPVDKRALRSLRRSPLALDIYVWLTHRMYYLREPVTIPWEALQLQFGADYRRIRAFREHFLRALAHVRTEYPQARVDRAIDSQGTDHGIRLKPSPTHIRTIRTR